MPKESSHKEILTKEIIKKEALRYYRWDAIRLLTLIPPCVLVVCAIIFFASFLNEIWYNIIFYGLLSLFAVAYIGLALALIILRCYVGTKLYMFSSLINQYIS